MLPVVLAGTGRTDQWFVLTVFVHADELFGEVVVLTFPGFELEVCDHVV